MQTDDFIISLGRRKSIDNTPAVPRRLHEYAASAARKAAMLDGGGDPVGCAYLCEFRPNDRGDFARRKWKDLAVPLLFLPNENYHIMDSLGGEGGALPQKEKRIGRRRCVQKIS